MRKSSMILRQKGAENINIYRSLNEEVNVVGAVSASVALAKLWATTKHSSAVRTLLKEYIP